MTTPSSNEGWVADVWTSRHGPTTWRHQRVRKTLGGTPETVMCGMDMDSPLFVFFWGEDIFLLSDLCCSFVCYFLFGPLYKKNDLHIFSSVQLILFWRHTKTQKSNDWESDCPWAWNKNSQSDPGCDGNAEFGCLERCLEGWHASDGLTGLKPGRNSGFLSIFRAPGCGNKQHSCCKFEKDVLKLKAMTR